MSCSWCRVSRAGAVAVAGWRVFEDTFVFGGCRSGHGATFPLQPLSGPQKVMGDPQGAVVVPCGWHATCPPLDGEAPLFRGFPGCGVWPSCVTHPLQVVDEEKDPRIAGVVGRPGGLVGGVGNRGEGPPSRARPATRCRRLSGCPV